MRYIKNMKKHPLKPAKQPTKPISIRLSAEHRSLIEAGTQASGQPNISAFIKAAALSAARNQDATTELGAIEARLAATSESLLTRIRGLENAIKLSVNLIDGLTKVVLTCVPEPTGEVLPAARANAKTRYAKLVQTMGAKMTQDLATTVAQSLNNE